MQSVICSLQSAVCSLQSAVCSLQSAVCSLQSAVCSLQSANVTHRDHGGLRSKSTNFQGLVFIPKTNKLLLWNLKWKGKTQIDV